MKDKVEITKEQLQQLIHEVESRVRLVVCDDIDFGYDIDMIRHKYGSKRTLEEAYSVETFQVMRPFLEEHELWLLDIDARE